LGSPYPGWYLKIREQKFMFGIMGWVLGNAIIGSLTQTGAFEILVDNRLVFSKLATNQLPTVDVVFEAVDRLLK
jgi:selT/selW/selH-like putative selenoprotein